MNLFPLLAWMVLIAALSGPLGSEETMRRGITWLLSPISGFLQAPAIGDIVPGSGIWTLRKTLHLIEYALLAVLAHRWFASFDSLSLDNAVLGSLLLSGGYAALDEFHQAFIAGRTGSPADVVIDLLGASLVLAIIVERRTEVGNLIHRLIDIIGAGIGILLVAPILLVATVSVWLNMGRPVLYRQRRLGRYERPFTIFKFRTMINSHKVEGRKLTATERLTPTGRVLRQCSIDELPQLWNVLKGEMSLVGPRPLHIDYLPYYTPRERTRHLVRPGITGLAQVRGRNRAPWDERLELDAVYVERKSLRLDVRILLETIIRVARRSDVLDTAIEGSLITYRERMRPQKSIAS